MSADFAFFEFISKFMASDDSGVLDRAREQLSNGTGFAEIHVCMLVFHGV